jgi:hypothetical protein
VLGLPRAVDAVIGHRVYGLGRNERHHYPSYAPKVVFHRVRHWAIGPLLGCSCSRCFNHPRRIIPAREFYASRVSFARFLDELNSERVAEGKTRIVPRRGPR